MVFLSSLPSSTETKNKKTSELEPLTKFSDTFLKKTHILYLVCFVLFLDLCQKKKF